MTSRNRKFFSVRRRLFVYFTIPMIIPLLIFGLYAIKSSQELANEEVVKSTEKTLKLTSLGLEQLLQHLVFVSNDLYLDYKVNKTLIVPASDIPYSRLMEENQYVNDRILNLSSRLGNVQFLFRLSGYSGREFPNQIANQNSPLNLDSQWYRKTTEHPGRIEWVLDEKGEIIKTADGVPLLIGVRIISNLITGMDIGVLAVGLHKSYIEEYLILSSREGELLLAIERDGKVVASSTPDMTGISDMNEIQSLSSGDILVIDNRKYLVTRSELKETLWSLMLLTPINRYFAHVQRWRIIVMISLILTLISSFIISSIVSSRLSKPIIALSKDMMQISRGDITLRSHVSTNDEIGILADSFNHMLDQINELMKDLQVEQRAKIDSELKALFSQINPHFLYNTLAGIRFMIGNRSDNEINEALLSLTQFLRHLFAASNEIVPIRDEVENLTHYMRIQEIRSVGNIRFTLNIDDSIMDCPIPKLMLQPLVENAIFHGLGTRGGKGTITITAHEIGNQIVFEVIDTIDDNDSTPAASNIDKLNGTGIGLTNVNERLQLYYGEEYSVRLNEDDFGHIHAEMSIAKQIKKRTQILNC
ncbi:MAG: histidine kinase [Spirochaetales bacterium]|nr:histidine kinase [Spirochaetales bacterium]